MQERDAEQAKKHEYFKELTLQIRGDGGKKQSSGYDGMSKVEREFNKKVIDKMSRTKR